MKLVRSYVQEGNRYNKWNFYHFKSSFSFREVTQGEGNAYITTQTEQLLTRKHRLGLEIVCGRNSRRISEKGVTEGMKTSLTITLAGVFSCFIKDQIFNFGLRSTWIWFSWDQLFCPPEYKEDRKINWRDYLYAYLYFILRLVGWLVGWLRFNPIVRLWDLGL